MFIINQIGLTLKETREKNSISLEEAGKDLDIKPLILANIEAGNIGCFKDIFELKEYIASYAKYLGLDRVFSPYTKQINVKNKHIVWIYVIIAIVVALVIFWAVKQITVDNTKTSVVSVVR